MVLEVSDACMFMKTAKDVWDNCKQNYSKVGDAVEIYEIKIKIVTTKQGDWSVSEYAQNLQNLWLELVMMLQQQTNLPDPLQIIIQKK